MKVSRKYVADGLIMRKTFMTGLTSDILLEIQRLRFGILKESTARIAANWEMGKTEKTVSHTPPGRSPDGQ